MRMLLKAQFPVEAGNAAAKTGKLAEILESILAEQKPEAAYFFADDGKRTALLVLDIQDASQLPALAEPWFLALNASVEVIPALTAADLPKIGAAIEQAVKKYGGSKRRASTMKRRCRRFPCDTGPMTSERSFRAVDPYRPCPRRGYRLRSMAAFRPHRWEGGRRARRREARRVVGTVEDESIKTLGVVHQSGGE
jgi:hypothetical protein